MTDVQIDEEIELPDLEPTNVQKLRGLPWSVAFDVANTFFVYFTFFGSVFVLFLNDLRFTKTQIGFLLSLFPFFGLISLLIAPQVARFGYKRTFLTFFGIRNLFTACLLFVPWIVARSDPRWILFYVAGVTIAFAISRSVAMTALLPWQQEYIPNEIRGKYSAYSNIFISLTGLVAVSVAGYVVGRVPGLYRYTILFGLGVLFGFISIYLASFIPGGASVKTAQTRHSNQANNRSPLRDRNFILYLAGIGLVTLATGPMFSFLPLYMQEKVGLSTGNVVFLTTGTLLGSLISSFLWGWMADRYGSRPVMLSGLFLNITLPIWWLIMPRQSDWSLYAAMAIALLQGIAGIGWGIGAGRLLYVSIVPSHHKGIYLAQYNAWTGLIGGLSQLLGGSILDRFAGVRGEVLGFEIDSYAILFGAGFLLPLVSSLVLRLVRTTSEVSLGEFAGLFIHGNPLLAVESLIRYHLARDEPAAVSVTERLGHARSPLTVDELLEALSDPRFYVRFEAIVSIARRGPDNRLMNALVKVLEGNDPALGVVAAWALGRIGDPRALPPLRQALDSPYRSIRAHAARSLGTLGDQRIVPVLLDRLETETDAGLQLAYASVLGKLHAAQAAPHMLSLLRLEENPDSRKELSLSLARLVGDENRFIQLMRSMRTDPGTVLSQATSAIRKKVSSLVPVEGDLPVLIDDCADTLARGDLDAGARLLVETVRLLPLDEFCAPCRTILLECVDRIQEFGAGRMEYIALAVYTLNEELR